MDEHDRRTVAQIPANFATKVPEFLSRYGPTANNNPERFFRVSAVEWIGCLRNDLHHANIGLSLAQTTETPDPNCSVNGVLNFYVDLAKKSNFQGLDFEIPDITADNQTTNEYFNLYNNEAAHILSYLPEAIAEQVHKVGLKASFYVSDQEIALQWQLDPQQAQFIDFIGIHMKLPDAGASLLIVDGSDNFPLTHWEPQHYIVGAMILALNAKFNKKVVMVYRMSQRRLLFDKLTKPSDEAKKLFDEIQEDKCRGKPLRVFAVCPIRMKILYCTQNQLWEMDDHNRIAHLAYAGGLRGTGGFLDPMTKPVQ
ncbi:hypothetical protein Ddc_08255 [Ditylenchus destructor]|nr:hypothetical protein Ddc_08255 [Ditylenchus destructor]